MNKQELASRIWQSANDMRSKIEANEYKDYILGFIFYKFLSDNLENDLRKQDEWEDEDFKEMLVESDEATVKLCQQRYGYFIEYKNLFSTWLKDSAFDVSDVRDGLSAFNRLVADNYKKVFEKIFDTLETGLSKLGENSGAQTKAIRKLMELINPIPMDDKQGYDVLGYIYEYLISMFAANAGKKAGEFYTPHEVSLVMSQIVADHVKDRETIEIYDPTSGSGSLLINIGQSVAKYLKDKDKIKYYAQELKENTYSLTRMNLIMRGIKPANIIARNGDTLADDWPYFEENDRENTYQPLFVDAVVSNPPYSQKWEQREDARFSGYGIAPTNKADYAFLLHDLYHLKSDGIMTIVLPHGVLFRGGEEGKIRQNLIENDNIDAIIGLPANIFFGTGIPTIIMVLRKQRDRNDVLIIDASKGFIKDGKKNKLRESDIKRIVDTVINRESIDKYSRVVSKDEIRKNEYNLNIPRYVDANERPETYDLYASMFGGVPSSELDEYKKYWDEFPTLKNELFTFKNEHIYELKVTDIKDMLYKNEDVKAFIKRYRDAFTGFGDYLDKEIVKNSQTVNITKVEGEIANDIFARVGHFNLLDKYDAYQIFSEKWNNIGLDLEMIQTEGFAVTRLVNSEKVTDKMDEENGYIIPFNLVQEKLLKDDLNDLKTNERKLEDISSFISSTLEEFSEEELDEIEELLNDDKTAFKKPNVDKYVKRLKGQKFSEDSLEARIIDVSKNLNDEKTLKSRVKSQNIALKNNTIAIIEKLSDEQVLEFLKLKWIDPLINELLKLPITFLDEFSLDLKKLSEKYDDTYLKIENEIKETENSLAAMIDELDANEFDKKGLLELQKLLRGEIDE
jgi:type I restriction enzyme M protein